MSASLRWLALLGGLMLLAVLSGYLGRALLDAGRDDQNTEAIALPLDRPCAPARAPCLARGTDGWALRFSVSDRAAPLKPFRVVVVVEAPAPVNEVFVDFDMTGMDMGTNRYELISSGTREWSGEVILPVCISGRTDWVARVTVVTSQARARADLPLQLEGR